LAVGRNRFIAPSRGLCLAVDLLARPDGAIRCAYCALRAAARGLLDMTQIELAAGASVSKNAIVDFEKGRSTPVKNNLAAIQRVLEEAGVEFTDGEAPGLRWRKKKR
jgi:DNA-binding XRE family transcriptional regulator